jgi:hypothetical protein
MPLLQILVLTALSQSNKRETNVTWCVRHLYMVPLHMALTHRHAYTPPLLTPTSSPQRAGTCQSCVQTKPGSSATHRKLVPANPNDAAASSQASPSSAPMPTSERARPGDRRSGPHTHSSSSSRDQNCVRPCCQSLHCPMCSRLTQHPLELT